MFCGLFLDKILVYLSPTSPSPPPLPVLYLSGNEHNSDIVIRQQVREISTQRRCTRRPAVPHLARFVNPQLYDNNFGHRPKYRTLVDKSQKDILNLVRRLHAGRNREQCVKGNFLENFHSLQKYRQVFENYSGVIKHTPVKKSTHLFIYVLIF